MPCRGQTLAHANRHPDVRHTLRRIIERMFSCPTCDATPETRHEGRSQITVVAHAAGCETYCRAVVNRYPLKPAELPETDRPIAFEKRGDYGRFHTAIQRRERQRQAAAKR